MRGKTNSSMHSNLKPHYGGTEEGKQILSPSDNENTDDDEFSSSDYSSSSANADSKSNKNSNGNIEVPASHGVGIETTSGNTKNPTRASGKADDTLRSTSSAQTPSPTKKIKTAPIAIKSASKPRMVRYMRPQDFLPSYLRPYVRHSHGDFFVSSSFDPHLVAGLMYEGFLPIATPRHLVPKLHKHRCVIYPLRIDAKNEEASTSESPHNMSAVHISKNVKKRAKKYNFTINRDFSGVVNGCHNQHGIGWLYDPIVRSFWEIHNSNAQSQSTLSRNHRKDQGPMFPVNLYSIEVWNAVTGELAGGELGYASGTVYTSLTGFTTENSAGSVQLAALGQFLYKEGFDMWDLGMKLDYKIQLGARDMERMEFVEIVRVLREKSARIGSDGTTHGPWDLLQCHDKRNCKSIIVD